MNTKIATNREFHNIWFRTGKDPDGNDMPRIVLGGNEDSYTRYALFKQSVINAQEFKSIFNFVESVASGRTLFIGEGNFSFCLSIAKQIRNPYNIIATTNEAQNEFSDLTKQNISSLQKLGVKVFCKTDATEINRDFVGQTFDNIIFQFPHTGSREPIEGRNPNFILLRDFLKSAKPLLLHGGKVIVSIVDSPYYQGAFGLNDVFSSLCAASPSSCQIEEAGTEAMYKRYTAYTFNPLLFPNYIHTMTNEDESAISKNDDLITIVFEV
jgi:hypothetical protein